MKLITQLVFFLFIMSGSYSLAQFPGCPNVYAGQDSTLDCGVPCIDLNAVPFDAGATTSYAVNSIPYSPPVTFGQAGGTPVSVGTDDVWSGVINLPFDFCFYGQTYNQCVIGSNGCISFNTSYAFGYHEWSFTASIPSPVLVQSGDIFGPYHDIDPSVGGSVQWYLLGTAPCRIFVVTYNTIPMFSCNNLTSSHMIVLYETTNAIDVYVELREVCGTWNGGNGVIGVQNPTGSQGIAAPGRNTGPWGVTTPEGWRFLPNGAPIYTVEWFEGATSIGTGNTVNVCPTAPTTYTAVATYTSCNGTVIVEQDDVTITPTPTGMVVSEVSNTPANCSASDGSFEVSTTGGTGPYTYSLDNITYQGSGLFTGLAAGNYTVFVQDALGCITTYNITVQSNSSLTLDFTLVQDVSCNGANDGSISVVATGGTSPYSFTLNGGASQSLPDFTGLGAGTYTIEVTDNAGCTAIVDTTIIDPAPMILTVVGTVNTTCGQANGELEVSVSGGSTPYSFSIDSGTTTQGSGVFTGLSAGTYSVVVIDNGGCMDSIDVIVSADPFPVLSVFSVTDATCNGDSDGSITLNTSGGASPYTYTINGGSSQSSNVFSNLPAGTYTFEVTDNNGCTSTVNGIINEPNAITINMGADFSICVGTQVTINANASGGTGTLTYNWNVGGSSSTVTETPASTTTYTVTVTDANGCSSQASQVVTVLPLPVADGIANPNTGYPPLTVVFNNTSNNGATYTWNFGNGLTQTTSGTTNVTTTYTDPGDYVVVLTASNGICEDTWTTLIVVIPYDPVEYNIPNIFTPNDDGNNDLFEFDVKNAANVEFTITNRWGNVMYEAEGPNPAWDGKTKAGDMAEDGTYFITYKIVGLNGEEFTGHTFFQLMK